MFNRAILVMAALGVMGCGAPPDAYDVRLDTTLTPPQSERVLDALNEWGQKTGVNYRTNFSDWPCAMGAVSAPRGCAHIQFASDEQAQALCGDGQGHHELGCDIGDPGRWGNVYLTELDSGEAAYALALHELGHAFGLAHDTGNSVMRVPAEYQAHYVTDRDVAQFNRVRGF